MKTTILIFVVLSLLVLLLCTQSSIAQTIQTDSLLQKAKVLYQSIEQLDVNANNGTPRSIRGTLAKNVNLNNAAKVKQFLHNSKSLFRINETSDDFTSKKVFNDKLNMAHAKLQQTYKGVPVFGSELVLHSDATNTVVEVNGRFTPDLNINVTPSVTSEGALNIALADLGPAEYRWQNSEQEKIIKEVYHDTSKTWQPKPELVISPKGGDFDKGEYRLAWKMKIPVDGAKLGNWEYFIDAKTGEIINKFNSMPDASGISNYNGTVSFSTKYVSPLYQLYDETRSIKTYNANFSSSFPGTLLTDNDDYWDQNNAAVDAHWGATKVYDFYLGAFGRTSFDDNGAEIRSSVNAYYNGWNNAVWNGSQMLYGNGDGSTFSSLTSLDVCAHELTHAVTEHEADLIYQGESGALNEAMSDIFGTTVEFYATPSKANWLIGEECYTPNTAGDALRYMNNPNAGNQPDTYLGTYWYTGSGDYGGVHTNSGVLNFAFYLMTVGGNGTNDSSTTYNVTGIGIEKTRAIAYRALTTYLTSSSNYAAARTAFLSSVSDLYGSTSAEYKTVSDAFGAVGIGIKLIVKNSFEAGTIKVNNATVNSGYNYFVASGTSQTYEAIPQYYNPYNRVWNTSGATASISNWRKQLSGQASVKIPDATNISYPFTASTSDHNATYIADLKNQFNVTVSTATYIEPGSGGTYNVIASDGTHYNSVTSWNGTFIQDGTTPITLEAVPPSSDWIVSEWEDDAGVKRYGNPLVLTPADHIYGLHAKFKQHLTSTTSFATGANNQKKMAKSEDGTLFMTYESNGRSFLTSSTTQGASWNPEQLLLGDSETRTPSVARHPHYGEVVVIMEELATTDNGTTWIHRIKDNKGVTLDTFTASRDFYARPSINCTWFGHGSDVAFAVWSTPTGLKCAFLYGDGIWTSTTSIPSTDGTCINPSAAIEYLDIVYFYQYFPHVVWEKQGQIYHSQNTFYNTPLTLMTWTSPVNLSPSLVATDSHNPSIALYFDQYAGQVSAHVMWHGKPGVAVSEPPANMNKSSSEPPPPPPPPPAYRIMYRYQTSSTSWSSAAILYHGNDQMTSPSIAFSFATQCMEAVWNCGNHIGYATRNLSTGQWSAVCALDYAGLNPTINTDLARTSTRGTFAAWTKQQGAFWKLNTVYNPDCAGHVCEEENLFPKTSGSVDTTKLYHFRLGTIDLSTMPFGSDADSLTGIVHIIMGRPSLKVGNTWKKMPFTSLRENSNTAPILGTRSVYVPSNADSMKVIWYLQFKNVRAKRLPTLNPMFITTNLVNLSRGTLLHSIGGRTIREILLNGIRDTSLTITNRVSVASLRSDSIQVQFSLTGEGTSHPPLFREIYYTTGSNDAVEPFAQPCLLGSDKYVPTSFDLRPNYPNPFNPSTSICYQLPVPSYINITVFNVLGQEIELLAAGYQDRGDYTIVWSGRNSASGIYIVRMTARDEFGKQLYQNSRKLLLVK